METLADKLIQIAENEQKVYNAGYEKGKSESSDVEGSYNQGFDAGKQAEYDAFWDEYQQNGKRTDYTCAFSGKGWNNRLLRPKYNIIAKNMYQTFLYNNNNIDLAQVLEDCGVTFDTSNATTLNYAFQHTGFTRVPVIDTNNAAKLVSVFAYSEQLKSIEKLVLKTDGSQTFNSLFTQCYALENLTIEGIIGQNGFNVGDCSLLSHDSLMSIINALEDKAFSTKISGSWKFNDSWVGDCATIERNLNYSVEGDEHAFNIIYIDSPIIAQAVFDEEVQGSISYVVDLNGKTVDFGTTPQTISEQAAEWIAQNATSQGGTITTETGTVWTVTLGTTNLAKLTDAEKAIATQKGWTLA